MNGKHTLKTGVQYLNAALTIDVANLANNLGATDAISYIFTGPLAAGIPTDIIEYATPLLTKGNQWTLGWYVQDQWRITKRLTLSPGIRYDHLDGSVPPTTMPAGEWVPARSFPAVSGVPICERLEPSDWGGLRHIWERENRDKGVCGPVRYCSRRSLLLPARIALQT